VKWRFLTNDDSFNIGFGMWNKSFQEMGIPLGYGFRRLLYSPAAKSVIVQAESSEKNWRPERLYFRHEASDKYNPVGEPGDLVSQDYPFLHPSKPLLAYNSLKHRFSVDATGEERHSGDWHSLNLFDLASGLEVNSITEEKLTLPPGIETGWVSMIVAFSEAGLFVQAGLSKESSRMDYFIAKIGLSTHVLTPIVALPATFM
jgi:hypothetical protein